MKYRYSVLSLLILLPVALNVSALSFPAAVESGAPGEDAERHLPLNYKLRQWKNESEKAEDQEQKTELKKVLQQNVTTKKLENVVPPIQFKSGQADIPENYVELLRDVLDKMKNRLNVRLHFIGHTDDVKLSGNLKAQYGDNEGLSRERAGTTAEFFQRALHLPPEAISFDGMGDRKPVASNNTAAGRTQNRRVEVEVWYDIVDEKLVEKTVKIKQDSKRVFTCRVETVCKIQYKEGHSKRARLKNLIKPMRYEDGMSELPASFMKQLKEALHNLRNKSNVTIKFIGHTDNLPLTGRLGRIYGEHVALSKAQARRIALTVQEKLKLPNKAIDSGGKGAAWPVASNDNETGRAANRRIEVEFWHDDALQDVSSEPQLCPEAAGAETVERIHEPPAGNVKPVYFEQGKPIIPPGYTERLKRIMQEVADKGNVRVRFIGYTNNARLDRRTAMVYGDDIGLSTSRARRAMEAVKALGNFSTQQLEYEGRGFVHSDDVVNAGFLEVGKSRVEARVIYDDLAEIDDLEGLEIERISRDVNLAHPMSLNLLRISIDGKPIDDMGKSTADVQRCTDVALEQADIEFKFDNLALKPRLNITAWPHAIERVDNLKTSFPENLVTFKAYSNYSAFIDRAEVRVFNKHQSVRDIPVNIIPVDMKTEAEWFIKLDDYAAPLKEIKYLLRVYDKDGKFDETRTQTLWVVDKLKTENKDNETTTQNASIIGVSPILSGYGENRLNLQTIPLSGGTIKVNGAHIPDEHSVWFAGNKIPLTEDRKFIAEEIIPQGLHNVEVAVLDAAGNGELFFRDFELKKNDWFFVGIADFTLSRDATNGPANMVTGDEVHYDNDTVAEGRIAFYTHGKFGDEWELTASADTLEGPIDDLFSNFMDKSPDAVFRRLDPDYYYPTFGDDSTVEETAPTLGKFYLKLKKANNYGMWGNFKISYLENSLAHVDRTLYGANFHYETEAITSFGEKTFTVDVFAAEPGTIQGRDEFKGTGGSLYFLKHQDILVGSDRARIEVRDKLSGQVLSVRNLVPAIDYDIDTIQGRIMLSEPLSATSNDGSIVSNGAGNNEQYLVVRYEYSPGFEETDELSTGARVQGWINDSIKIGASFSAFGEGEEEDRLAGVDFTYRMNAGTWIKVEHAINNGFGDLSSFSNDGGYNFNETDSALLTADEARASKLDASIQFADLFDGANGKATFYTQELEAGYNAPGLTALSNTTITGGTVEYPVLDDLSVKLKTDRKIIENGLHTSAIEVDADYKLTDQWTLSSGVKSDQRDDHSVAIPLTQQQGDRTDLAIKASYDSGDDWQVYSFIQDTVKVRGNREENDRLGVGGEFRATDNLKLNGEISGGELGTAAKVGTDYLMSDKTNLYLNYTLENERTDNGVLSREGSLTSGFKSRYTDSVSVYMEEKYSHGDVPTGLTHTMGTDIEFNDRFTFGANLDVGELEDQQTSAVTERNAVGFRFGYSYEKIKYAGAIEFREDNIENPDTSSSERTTIFYKNSLKYQINPDWRLISKYNHSTSESSLGEFYDGNFTEAVLGYAYRPVNNDRLNALIKYTYFYNVPSAEQETIPNTSTEYIQKSRIVSFDLMYDISHRWSLGGKYAHRFGELSIDRVDPQFFESNADLFVLRADWHFAHRWDALIEARKLEVTEAGDSRSGALLAFYRHFKKNAKLGIGYNFTDFSDDLTDLDYDSKGFFINIVAKY